MDSTNLLNFFQHIADHFADLDFPVTVGFCLAKSPAQFEHTSCIGLFVNCPRAGICPVLMIEGENLTVESESLKDFIQGVKTDLIKLGAKCATVTP